MFEYDGQITQDKLQSFKNKLVKITIFDEEMKASRANEANKLYPQVEMAPINRTISEHLRFKKCIVYPNKGVLFTAENDQFEMFKKIQFGMPLMEVLQRLGNPNKEYYSGSKLFLNYLELGLDILIENVDWTVKKFILHANNTQMPDFCFYDRCSFELLLSR